MESLYKLIDDSKKLDEDRNYIELLINNSEFKSSSEFYLKNGRSIKHKLVVKLFFLNSKMYIFIGRTFYPILKRLNFAA